MRVALVFPPPWDPTMPYLSLPALAASLRQAGHDPLLFDGAVSFAHYLLYPQTAQYLQHKIKNSPSLTRLFDGLRLPTLESILELGERLEEQAPAALNALTHREHFASPQERSRAWQTLEEAYLLASYAHFPTRVGPQSLATRRDLLHPAQLLLFAEDYQENPFRAFLRQELLPTLLARSPDIVAFSIASPQQLPAAVTFARLLQSEQPRLPLLAGGPFLTCVADDLPQHPEIFEAFDAIFLGEGEQNLPAWCDHFATGQRPTSLPGLLTPSSNPKTPPSLQPWHPADQADWPCPAYQDLDLQAYLAPSPVLPLLTQRGCYYGRCAFCSGLAVHQHTFRERPAETVLSDLQTLHRLGPRYFSFSDQATTPRMLFRLAHLLLQENLDLRWMAQVRFEPALTLQRLQLLFQAGCRVLIFGLESAVERIRQRMNKGGSVHLARRILEDCATVGIAVQLFLIVGFPDESPAEAQQTLRFVLDLPTSPGSAAFVHPFVIERGSLVQQQPQHYNLQLLPHHSPAIPYQLDYRSSQGLTASDAFDLAQQLSPSLSQHFPQPTPSLAHSLLALHTREDCATPNIKEEQ